MSAITWGKPIVEIAAYIAGVQPQKRFVLIKQCLTADTTIEIAKGSGIAVGDIIGYGKKSVASTLVVTTDPVKDVVTILLAPAATLPIGTILYESAAASPAAAVEKATWIEITPIKEDSTKLTTAKGAQQTATIEGGNTLDLRNKANDFTIECEMYAAKGLVKPIVDADGIVAANYMVRVTPEDNTLLGYVMVKAQVQVEENFSAKDGGTWKYTFAALLPNYPGMTKLATHLDPY